MNTLTTGVNKVMFLNQFGQETNQTSIYDQLLRGSVIVNLNFDKI